LFSPVSPTKAGNREFKIVGVSSGRRPRVHIHVFNRLINMLMFLVFGSLIHIELIEPSPRQAAGNLHREDKKNRFSVRSLTPPQAAGNALAIAVQPLKERIIHHGK